MARFLVVAWGVSLLFVSCSAPQTDRLQLGLDPATLTIPSRFLPQASCGSSEAILVAREILGLGEDWEFESCVLQRGPYGWLQCLRFKNSRTCETKKICFDSDLIRIRSVARPATAGVRQVVKTLGYDLVEYREWSRDQAGSPTPVRLERSTATATKECNPYLLVFKRVGSDDVLLEEWQVIPAEILVPETVRIPR